MEKDTIFERKPEIPVEEEVEKGQDIRSLFRKLSRRKRDEEYLEIHGFIK